MLNKSLKVTEFNVHCVENFLRLPFIIKFIARLIFIRKTANSVVKE